MVYKDHILTQALVVVKMTPNAYNTTKSDVRRLMLELAIALRLTHCYNKLYDMAVCLYTRTNE